MGFFKWADRGWRWNWDAQEVTCDHKSAPSGLLEMLNWFTGAHLDGMKIGRVGDIAYPGNPCWDEGYLGPQFPAI